MGRSRWIGITMEIIKYLTDLFRGYKVAIQISGQTRTFESNYLNYYENLIKPLNADIFIHTWDNEDAAKMVSLFKPVSHEIEAYKDSMFWLMSYKIKSSGLFDGPTNPDRILAQLYSKYKVNELRVKSNKKYDIVIGIRTELTLPRQLTKVELKLATQNLLIPIGFDASGGLNDIMYIANEKYANIYTSIYPDIQRIILDKYQKLDPHTILKYKLLECNVPIKRIDYKILLRDMEIWKM